MVKLTKDKIDSRTKDASYVTLSKAQIAKVVMQLPEKKQERCFSKAKTIKPLSFIEARGMVGWIENLSAIDKRPLSEIPLKDLYGIIKTQINKNPNFKAFVEENGYGEEALVSEETPVPGDFSPSGLWAVLDEMLPDLDMAPVPKKVKTK